MNIAAPRTTINTIVWTNVVLFVISLIFSGSGMGLTLNPFHALAPSMESLTFLGASGTIPIEQYRAWWSLFTANWLHGSLIHILFNMMALRTVGPLVIKEFGVSRMFSIYTLAGVAGFYASYLGRVPLTIGASTGLCGLIGALLFFGKARGGEWGRLVFQQTRAWIVSLVLIGFLVPNINNWGHGGGLLGGILAGMLLGYNERRRENITDRILAIVLAAVTVFLLVRSVAQGVALIFL